MTLKNWVTVLTDEPWTFKIVGEKIIFINPNKLFGQSFNIEYHKDQISKYKLSEKADENGLYKIRIETEEHFGEFFVEDGDLEFRKIKMFISNEIL